MASSSSLWESTSPDLDLRFLLNWFFNSFSEVRVFKPLPGPELCFLSPLSPPPSSSSSSFPSFVVPSSPFFLTFSSSSSGPSYSNLTPSDQGTSRIFTQLLKYWMGKFTCTLLVRTFSASLALATAMELMSIQGVTSFLSQTASLRRQRLGSGQPPASFLENNTLVWMVRWVPPPSPPPTILSPSPSFSSLTGLFGSLEGDVSRSNFFFFIFSSDSFTAITPTLLLTVELGGGSDCSAAYTSSPPATSDFSTMVYPDIPAQSEAKSLIALMTQAAEVLYLSETHGWMKLVLPS